MIALTTKYRPKTIADLRGQPRAVNDLKAFLTAPYSTAMLFAGASGTGKTSASYALANDLGVDVEQQELGGLFEIASGDMTKDNVRETFERLRFYPLFGSGWRVLIVNECDAMDRRVEILLLDILEHLPDRAIAVFTTNDPGRLTDRFKDRCMVQCEFKAAPTAAAELVRDIWRAETGKDNAPSFSTLGIDGNSFRAALAKLTPFVNRAWQLKAGAA